VFEVKIDWGCDSGFFFRTTGGDRAYQVTIDHLTGGTVGGIYGESFATLVQALDFTLTDLGSTAVVTPGRTPIFDLAAWPTIWHPTDFNEIRARIEGNPPHTQVWISNLKVSDFTDDQVRNEIGLAGPLAIQVHGGDRFIAGGAVRFRNVRAKDLTLFCMDALDAGDASPGTSQPEAATERDAQSIDAPATGSGTALLRDVDRLEAGNVGGHAEVRPVGVTLGMEDIHRIRRAR